MDRPKRTVCFAWLWPTPPSARDTQMRNHSPSPIHQQQQQQRPHTNNNSQMRNSNETTVKWRSAHRELVNAKKSKRKNIYPLKSREVANGAADVRNAWKRLYSELSLARPHSTHGSTLIYSRATMLGSQKAHCINIVLWLVCAVTTVFCRQRSRRRRRRRFWFNSSIIVHNSKTYFVLAQKIYNQRTSTLHSTKHEKYHIHIA